MQGNGFGIENLAVINIAHWQTTLRCQKIDNVVIVFFDGNAQGLSMALQIIGSRLIVLILIALNASSCAMSVTADAIVVVPLGLGHLSCSCGRSNSIVHHFFHADDESSHLALLVRPNRRLILSH
jgi:hypothetical protein